jgi:hypothetical protein
MSIEILRERFRTKIAFQLDLELWFAGPAYRKHDLILSVYDGDEELASKAFTFEQIWQLMDDNEFWEPEERDEAKKLIVARMRKFLKKLEAVRPLTADR